MASPAKYFYQKLTEISCEYKWTLCNLSSYKMPYMCSESVSCCSIDYWYLKLYLDSSEIKGTAGKIYIFLHSENDFEIRVKCEITLSSIKDTYSTKKFSHTFKNKKSSWGLELMERDVLLDDLKKGNDTLIINWKMFIIEKPKLSKRWRSLAGDIWSLLDMKESADVTLITSDGIEHKAHKAILMCRSRVFLAMFQSNMTESQNNLVKIEDVDSNTLEQMLFYIYTGEADNIEANAQKLLIVADKYELNGLKKICINKLKENMNINNIFELMEFAHTYEFRDLKKHTEEYFLKNHKEIVLTMGRETINNLSPHIATKLLYELATSPASKLSESN